MDYLALTLEPHDYQGADEFCSHVHSDRTVCGLRYVEHSVEEVK